MIRCFIQSAVVLTLLTCAYLKVNRLVAEAETDSYHFVYETEDPPTTSIHPNDEPEDFADHWTWEQKQCYVNQFPSGELRIAAANRVWNSTRSAILRQMEWDKLEAKMQKDNEEFFKKFDELNRKRKEEARVQEEIQRQKEQEEFQRKMDELDRKWKEEARIKEEGQKKFEEWSRIWKASNKQAKDVHYKTLGLTTDATQLEVKKAFRELALKYHPDKVCKTSNNCNEAIQKFRDITDARDALIH